MKKLMILAVCAMAVMMGCKNKDKTNPTTGMIDSATVAVIDSIFYLREGKLADDPHGHKDIELTKWTHCNIDYDNEWIWLRDKDEKNGAFFIRKDGKFRLMDVENDHQSPSRAQKDGKQLWKLFVLEVYGEMSECMLNNKEIS